MARFPLLPAGAVWSLILIACASRLATLFISALAVTLIAPHVSAQSNHPWTVPEIFARGGSPTGDPPEGISWSPDGKRATWIDDQGNLMQIQPPDGSPKKLINGEKIAPLLNAVISEQDRDHRNRYDEPDYIWAPDSNHLLFDTNGELWLYDLKTVTGVQIGNTAMQSGDDPKFSPNGQYVSYLRDHNLFVQRVDGSTPVLPLTTTRDDTVLNGGVDWVYLEELNVRSNYFWSPDSRQLAYLQMNEASVPQYPLVDFIPVHAVVNEQRYPQPGDPNPSVRVGVVGVNGGTTRWLKIPLECRQRLHSAPRLGQFPHRVGADALPQSAARESLVR